MKLPKFNQKGFGLHAILPVLVILIVSVIGVRLLTASHAASVVGGGGGSPTYFNGNIYTGGLSVWSDGTSPMTLSPPIGFANFFSNMSFDGTRVAYFTSPSYSTIYEGTITYYNNPASKASLALTNTSTVSSIPTGTQAMIPPMWSPDGTKVAATITSGASKTSDNIQIWVARTDSSGGHVVPNVPANISPYVSWRPGSVNIVYAPYASTASGSSICTVSDGGVKYGCHTIPLGTVKVGGALGQGGLAVSPTGGKVALVAYNFNTAGSATSADIYTVNPDGSGLKRLSKFAVNKRATAVVWSPDGTKIAYLLSTINSPTSSDGELWVMNAVDGSGKKQISTTSNYYPSLSWAYATGK